MEKINLFISYSHEDDKYLKELLKYLNDKNCPEIEIWYDQKISPGQEWDNEIKMRLDNADIILFLISQDFFNSVYIEDNELNTAYERQKKGECRIIPIFAKNCDLEDKHKITKQNGLPSPIKFFSDMGDERWGHYTIIQKRIRKIAQEIIEKKLESIEKKVVKDIGERIKHIELLKVSEKVIPNVEPTKTISTDKKKALIIPKKTPKKVAKKTTTKKPTNEASKGKGHYETGLINRYSDADLKEFKEIIERKLSDAHEELRTQKDALDRYSDSPSGNQAWNMTEGSDTSEMEYLMNQIARLNKFIRDLEMALVRIENKTYGICRATGKLIDKDRLRKVPQATLSMVAK